MIHCFLSIADSPYMALAQSACAHDVSLCQKCGMLVHHRLASNCADIQLGKTSYTSAQKGQPVFQYSGHTSQLTNKLLDYKHQTSVTLQLFYLIPFPVIFSFEQSTVHQNFTSHIHCCLILRSFTVSVQWKRLPTSNEPPPPRAYHSMTSIGSRFLLFGGFDGKNTFGDLWWLVPEGIVIPCLTEKRINHSCISILIS